MLIIDCMTVNVFDLFTENLCDLVFQTSNPDKVKGLGLRLSQSDMVTFPHRTKVYSSSVFA